MRTCRRTRVQRLSSAAGQSGFTLLELLVVVAVLGVVAGVVVFSMGAMTDEAQAGACEADERVLVTALEAYSVSSGTYGDEDVLVAAGYLASTSSSHDVVVSGDGYSIVPTGDCVAGSSEEVAGDALRAPDPTVDPTTTTAAPVAAEAIGTVASVNAVNVSTNKWRATATARVTDDLGGAVGGASVTLDVQRQSLNGSWSDLPDASGTTDASGSVVVSSPEVNKYPVPRMRFRLASVSAEGLASAPSDAWSDVARP